MTRDDVIRMALKVVLVVPSPRIDGGLSVGGCTVAQFEQFAELVAKQEREACAAICDAEGREWDSNNQICEKNYAAHCAAAIRARGTP